MSTSNSNSRKTPNSDTNKWFSSAGNLDDSLDSNPSKLTNVGHAPISKNQNESSYKSAGSTYIKPVKGLKDAHSAVVKNTRTDCTHVKSGSPINEKSKYKNGKSNKGSPNRSSSSKNKKTVIIVVVCILIVACAILCLNILRKRNNTINESDNIIEPNSIAETQNSGHNSTEYSVEYPDVEQYFKDNSSIVSVIGVKDSTEVLSESEAKQMLSSRGFTEYPVTTEYTIEGVITDKKEISETSADKHPIYVTYYVSSNNEVWLISIVEGTITASPLSYNLTYKDKTQIIVSESNEIISYDSSSNQFYKTIPNDTTMDVRCVDRIDAYTLDKMTVEVLVDD